MRQIHNSDRSDNSEVSNGTSPFALFRGRWGRSALRARGRAPWHRSTRAVEADPGPGEGAWIYAIRPVAARSETKRGRDVVFDRCATDSARGRGYAPSGWLLAEPELCDSDLSSRFPGTGSCQTRFVASDASSRTRSWNC